MFIQKKKMDKMHILFISRILQICFFLQRDETIYSTAMQVTIIYVTMNCPREYLSEAMSQLCTDRPLQR